MAIGALNDDDSGLSSTVIEFPKTKRRFSESRLLPAQYTKSDIVTIYVGKKRKEFKIYKDLLCAKSPFFAAKLSDCWDHGKREIYLQDEDENAFALLTNWIFIQEWKGIEHSTVEGMMQSAAAYRLADYLMMTKAKNDLVDMAIAEIREAKSSYSFVALGSLWSVDQRQTQLFNMMLRSAVQHTCYYKNPPIGLEDGFTDAIEVLKTIIKAMCEFNQKSWGPVWLDDKCEYHDHSDGSSCDP